MLLILYLFPTKTLFKMIKKNTLLSLITLLIINICYAQMPSQFNWQNTKAGWVGAGGVDGAAMISSEALIMKVTGNYPQFVYPNLNSGLTLDLNADLYESVTIELKNTSLSNDGISFRVFQESSEFPVMIFPIAVSYTHLTLPTIYSV